MSDFQRTSGLPAPRFNTTAFQLPSGNGWLHALLTLPDGDQARCAVLLCPPLAEERKAAQRTMTDGARWLAGSARCVVLRIDYRGCGDSAGAFETHDVTDWLADLAAAAAWLTRHFPALPQVRLGVRAGALLAMQPDPMARVAGLVCWDPVPGDAFLKQVLQRRMVNEMIAYGHAQTARQAIEATWQAGGSADLDGYTFTGRQAAQLRQLAFPAFDGPGLALATGADSREQEVLRQRAPAMESRSIRLAPFWNSVGQVDTQPLAEASAAWLQTAFADLRPFNPPDRARPVQADEAPLTLGVPGRAIRGVLHRPATDPPRAAFLFLGGWSGDRQGPHRLFLLFARRLAAAGNLCLRIDYRGRGESDGGFTDADITSMTDDADTAVRWLQETLPAGTPITLVAICSGCKVAIGATVRHPGIQRLVLWSAEAMGGLRSQTTNLRKTLGALRGYGQKLLRRETWRKLLRGKVRTGMVGKALMQHETRSAEEARAEDRLLAAFRNYRGAIRFIYGGSDPDASLASAAYARFCRSNGLRFELDVIPHAGHSFYGANWREELLKRTETWLENP